VSGGNPAPIVRADAIYTTADVAALLSHSTRWFRANRKRLNAEGFPPPVSCVGHPRWYGADLLAWLARPRTVAPPGAAVVPSSAPPAELVAKPVERIMPAPARQPAPRDDTLNMGRTGDLKERRAIVAKRLAMADRGLDPDNRIDVALARNLGIV